MFGSVFGSSASSSEESKTKSVVDILANLRGTTSTKKVLHEEKLEIESKPNEVKENINAKEERKKLLQEIRKKKESLQIEEAQFSPEVSDNEIEVTNTKEGEVMEGQKEVAPKGVKSEEVLNAETQKELATEVAENKEASESKETETMKAHEEILESAENNEISDVSINQESEVMEVEKKVAPEVTESEKCLEKESTGESLSERKKKEEIKVASEVAEADEGVAKKISSESLSESNKDDQMDIDSDEGDTFELVKNTEEMPAVSKDQEPEEVIENLETKEITTESLKEMEVGKVTATENAERDESQVKESTSDSLSEPKKNIKAVNDNSNTDMKATTSVSETETQALTKKVEKQTPKEAKTSTPEKTSDENTSAPTPAKKFVKPVVEITKEPKEDEVELDPELAKLAWKIDTGNFRRFSIRKRKRNMRYVQPESDSEDEKPKRKRRKVVKKKKPIKKTKQSAKRKPKKKTKKKTIRRKSKKRVVRKSKPQKRSMRLVEKKKEYTELESDDFDIFMDSDVEVLSSPPPKRKESPKKRRKSPEITKPRIVGSFARRPNSYRPTQIPSRGSNAPKRAAKKFPSYSHSAPKKVEKKRKSRNVSKPKKGLDPSTADYKQKVAALKDLATLRATGVLSANEFMALKEGIISL